jgi:hypothetical protein
MPVFRRAVALIAEANVHPEPSPRLVSAVSIALSSDAE